MNNIIFMIIIGMIIGLLILLVKNEVTFKCHDKILWAIFEYQKHIINEVYEKEKENCKNGDFTKPEITFDVVIEDMRSYEETLFCWWDWGYKHILPKEKYDIIKKYL